MWSVGFRIRQFVVLQHKLLQVQKNQDGLEVCVIYGSKEYICYITSRSLIQFLLKLEW